MAITNLTNTTWYIPSGWSSSSAFGRFSINGTVNQNGYETEYFSFHIGYSFDGDYNNTANSVLFDSYGITVYNSTQDFTFKITGGTDSTNPDLISWLETNGTQLKVDNLSDTTWTVASGWEAEAGYGEFDLIGTCNHDGYDYSLSPFCIGYYIDFQMFSLESLANSIVCNSNPDSIVSSDNFILTIEGGTDTTNPKLIAWLSRYGKLQGGEVEPTLTYDLSQLDLPEGTHSITVVAKADGYSNSAPSNAVEYVVESDSIVGTWLLNRTLICPSEYISITCDGVTTSFCDSSRSTIIGTTIRDVSTISVGPQSFYIFSSDVIEVPKDSYYKNHMNYYSISKWNSYTSAGFGVEIPSEYNEICRTVNFAKPIFDVNFTSWFKANATKVA